MTLILPHPLVGDDKSSRPRLSNGMGGRVIEPHGLIFFAGLSGADGTKGDIG
jgi:hypothetical protein